MPTTASAHEEALQLLIATAPASSVAANGPDRLHWLIGDLERCGNWRSYDSFHWNRDLEHIAHMVNDQLAAKPRIRTGLPVALSIEFDPEEWALEYRLDVSEAREDVRRYILHGLPHAFGDMLTITVREIPAP